MIIVLVLSSPGVHSVFLQVEVDLSILYLCHKRLILLATAEAAIYYTTKQHLNGRFMTLNKRVIEKKITHLNCN